MANDTNMSEDEGLEPLPDETPREETPQIAPTGQQEIIPDNPEINKMETHAPHVHHEPRKKVWHYFYEFIMLFLAVFCGLLAENWREHYVENQREKQYAHQLVEDLRSDSLYYAQLNDQLVQIISRQEKFIDLLSDETTSDKDIVASFGPLQWFFAANTTPATYNQMKSSGSIRYIRNKGLINKIQKYYEISIPYIVMMGDQSFRIYTTYVEPFSLQHFRRGDIDINADTLINKNPLYRNRTKDSDFQLRNNLAMYKEYLTITKERFLPKSISISNELLREIRQHYKLDR